MKKVFALILCGLPLMINAQGSFDVLQMSQTELRGTSRFQSMAGAFGALGGDLSVLSQNPAGIGVYRSSDAGVTLSLDCNSTKAGNTTTNETKFNVNNVGYVGAIRLDSETMPNLNFGFTFNRINSFNRHYAGGVENIATSLSNFIADQYVNANGYEAKELIEGKNYDPYFDSWAPWSAIVHFDMPTNNDGRVGIINANDQGMQGLYGDGTTANAYYEIEERGHADEYNIAFGGNIKNMVYWGLDLGILDLDYKYFHGYEEDLTNPYIMLNDHDLFNTQISNANTSATTGMYNYLHSEGTGVNFKLGLIFKPVQALRLGFAMHTPTFYDMRDTYYVSAAIDAYQDGELLYSADKGSNYGYDYSSEYTIRTPWRFIGSVAGVIGQNAILSADYEYVANQTMRMGDECGDNYPDVTEEMKTYFKPSHIIRIGGEYRVSPAWSLRAGYSYKTTQVDKVIDDYEITVNTAGTNTAYEYDNTVQYITCGTGFRSGSFYADLAYVHKMRESVYNAFSPINDNYGYVPNVSADVKDNNNCISLTLGMRF